MSYGHPDLLKGLPPEEAERTLALGLRRLVRSGETLFQLGDVADCLYLIDRGRLKLTLPMQVLGRDQEVLVEERNPGQTIGWSALIPPYRFTLTAVAQIDTEVIALSREALRAHFALHPEAGYAVTLNLATVVGQRLQLFQTMWLREMQRTVELHCA
jgi:CRP/FNR family transcriptional regulator, cyclic AMP receptor protein